MSQATPLPVDDNEARWLALLDQEFRSQHQPSGEPPKNVLTATPQEMEQELDVVTHSTRMAGFPALSTEQRQQMTGELTPSHRELLLAAIEVTGRKEIAVRTRFGPRIFHELLGLDVAAEQFGAAMMSLGQAYTAGEDMANRALQVLSTEHLLSVEEEKTALLEQGRRGEYERLSALYEPAFAEQTGIQQKAAPTAAAPRPTVKALREQLDTAKQDNAVMQNVGAIQQIAQTLAARGPILLPMGQATKKGGQ